MDLPSPPESFRNIWGIRHENLHHRQSSIFIVNHIILHILYLLLYLSSWSHESEVTNNRYRGVSYKISTIPLLHCHHGHCEASCWRRWYDQKGRGEKTFLRHRLVLKRETASTLFHISKKMTYWEREGFVRFTRVSCLGKTAWDYSSNYTAYIHFGGLWLSNTNLSISWTMSQSDKCMSQYDAIVSHAH